MIGGRKEKGAFCLLSTPSFHPPQTRLRKATLTPEEPQHGKNIDIAIWLPTLEGISNLGRFFFGLNRLPGSRRGGEGRRVGPSIPLPRLGGKSDERREESGGGGRAPVLPLLAFFH